MIAEESETYPALSSTATVTVTVADVNDNEPEFTNELYSVGLSETATPGTVITTIPANDRDTAIYGTPGLRYSLLGNGAEK